jgi:hypothetical protein
MDMTLANYIAWFKAHERLLFVLLACGLLWHFEGDLTNAWYNHEKNKATISDGNNVAMQKELTALELSTAQLNAKIDAAMKQRAIDTQKQKKTDDNLDATQLAARIQLLLGSGHVSVSTTDSKVGDTLVFDDTASHRVADDEEDLVQLRADNQDLNIQLLACNDLSGKKDDAMKTEKKAHVDDVNAEKANSKREFRRGFKWGAITGFIGGLFVGHGL